MKNSKESRSNSRPGKWAGFAGVLMSVVSLPSCGFLFQSYDPPNSGPIAVVGFVNESPCHFTIKLYEQSRNCVGRLRAVDLLGRGSQLVYVRAGSEVTFQYALDLEGTPDADPKGVCESDCVVNIRFTPASGAGYVFRGYQGCSGSLERIVSKNDLRPVKSKFPPWRRGFNEGSSFCTDDDRDGK